MAETSAESELGLRLLASCDKGDEEEVKRLLEHKEKDRFINQRDNEDESALFKAAKRGHFEIAQLLVLHGVDVNSIKDSDVQLSYVATELGHTKQMVIDLSSPQVGTISITGPVPSDPSDVNRVEGMSALMIASMNGDTKTARLLLEHGADVHITSTVFTLREAWSWAALMFACRNGRTQIVKLLLEYEAEFCVESEMSALVVASENRHHETAELLLEQGAVIDVESDVFESDVKLKSKTGTALMMASKNGDKKMIELLLKHGAKVNLQAKDSRLTALMFASDSGHTECATLLLKHGAKVNLQAKDSGWTALMFASDRGHTESATLLLEHGANVDIQGYEEKKDAYSKITLTALMAASKHGYTQIAKLLLEHKATINMQNNEGMTALMMATTNQEHEMVELLLEHGADANIQSNEGRSALMIASGENYTKIMKLLFKVANVNMQTKSNEWTALMFASDRGHTESAKLLLEHGANVDIQGYEMQDVYIHRKVTLTALMVASRKGYTEMAKLLLVHKATINMQNNEGTSALMIATANKKHETVELLLEYGADANAQNKTGWSALMFASKMGHTEVFKLLLKHGADVYMKESNGLTAFLIASQNGRTKIVKQLLAYPDIDVNMFNGKTSALMSAAQNGHTETVKMLLDLGADIDLQNNEGMSALMASAHNGHSETIKLLLEYKATVNLQKKSGWTALMLLISSSKEHPKLVQLLLENGANKSINLQGRDGWTALMLACNNRYNKVAELLLNHSAGVNIQKLNGLSALMIASKNGDTNTVELLLKYGADVTLKDDAGMSASMIARQCRSLKLAELLEKQESTLLASSSLSASTLTTVVDTIHHIRPVDLTAETSVTVTNSEQHFTWHEYGLNVHIPENSLPEGVQQCSIHIKASLAVEGLQLPQDTHLVSAVYSFKCSPKCQFSKRLTLEIQHCAKLEDSKELCFIRSISGSHFKVVESGGDVQSENVYYSHFPQNISYGFVDLDKFCNFGVGHNGVTNREYCANLYRYGVDQRHHRFHFNIVWDTKTHSKIIRDYYRNKKMKLEVCQRMEFEGSQIQLDIPFPSTEGIKSTSDDSWRILSLNPPLITKVEVDNFEKGKMIPCCQLLAECDKAVMPTDLKHSVQLKGAKDSYNALFICVPVTRKRTLDDQGDNYGPGHKRPRTSTLEMSFTTVLRELSSKVSAKWEIIGLFLGLEPYCLDIIKADNQNESQKCFSEMIKVWFRQQVDPPPSWSALIEALDVLGRNTLAQNLRDKYQIPS